MNLNANGTFLNTCTDNPLALQQIEKRRTKKNCQSPIGLPGLHLLSVYPSHQ